MLRATTLFDEDKRLAVLKSLRSSASLPPYVLQASFSKATSIEFPYSIRWEV